MQELQKIYTRSLGQEDPLEGDMAAHSSILAWSILWTEKPGGLQSKGLQSQTRLKRLSMHTYIVYIPVICNTCCNCIVL